MFKQSCTRFSHSLSYHSKRPIFSNFREIFVKTKTIDPKEQETNTEETNLQNQSPETKQPQAPNFDLKTSSQSSSIQDFKDTKIRTAKKITQDSFFPPFQKLEQDHMTEHTNYSLYNQLYSPYRWTPLVQKVTPSLEFHERMYQFRKVRNWEEHHTKELIDTILFEALRGTDYDYYYDYQCQPSKHCKFHGVADFLVYRKSGNHLPFTPIFKTQRKLNRLAGRHLDEFNICEAVGAANWTLTNAAAIDPNVKKVRILQTNGHAWRMYEFDNEGEIKKTGIYKPSGPGLYTKIYDDPELQEVVLGLIRHAAFIQTENEIGLKKAYDFIDEVKYLDELDEETKGKFEKRRRFWKFLPKKIQDFFFEYK